MTIANTASNIVAGLPANIQYAASSTNAALAIALILRIPGLIRYFLASFNADSLITDCTSILTSPHILFLITFQILQYIFPSLRLPLPQTRLFS